jgi:hypothetical protein
MYIGMYRDNFAWDIYCGDASQIVISYWKACVNEKSCVRKSSRL